VFGLGKGIERGIGSSSGNIVSFSAIILLHFTTNNLLDTAKIFSIF
jgi:phosphomevalonate kinase